MGEDTSIFDRGADILISGVSVLLTENILSSISTLCLIFSCTPRLPPVSLAFGRADAAIANARNSADVGAAEGAADLAISDVFDCATSAGTLLLFFCRA